MRPHSGTLALMTGLIRPHLQYTWIEGEGSERNCRSVEMQFVSVGDPELFAHEMQLFARGIKEKLHTAAARTP